MQTITRSLTYGYRDTDGTVHAEFEMRVPTLEDMEAAIEQAPPNASTAKLSRYIWARTITRLGTLPAEAITPELLGGLPYVEYAVLEAAEKDLLGGSCPRAPTPGLPVPRSSAGGPEPDHSRRARHDHAPDRDHYRPAHG